MIWQVSLMLAICAVAACPKSDVPKETFEQLRLEVINGEVYLKSNYSCLEGGSRNIEFWMNALSYFSNDNVVINLKITNSAKNKATELVEGRVRLTFYVDNEKKGLQVERRIAAKPTNGAVDHSITLAPFDKETKQQLFGKEGRYRLGIEIVVGKRTFTFRDRFFHVKDLRID